MSSKRKAEPAPGKSAGKQKLTEPEQIDSNDLLSMIAFEGQESNGDLLPAAEDLEGGEDGLTADDDDAALAAVLGGDEEEAPRPVEEEVGELPDGLEESALESPEEVDLTKYELTLPQARRVAKSLAQNSGLTKIRLSSHSLAISDLEDEELEWDSEEYGDVEAIIIAELLKANTTVARLDLARNRIGDAGACALATLLTENTTIEYLNLESNEFTETAGLAFCHAVGVNTSLTYLNLKENTLTAAVQDQIRDRWQSSEKGIGLHL